MSTSKATNAHLTHPSITARPIATLVTRFMLGRVDGPGYVRSGTGSTSRSALTWIKDTMRSRRQFVDESRHGPRGQRERGQNGTEAGTGRQDASRCICLHHTCPARTSRPTKPNKTLILALPPANPREGWISDREDVEFSSGLRSEMANKHKATRSKGELISNAQESLRIEQYWHLADRPAPRIPPKEYHYIEELAHLQLELI